MFKLIGYNKENKKKAQKKEFGRTYFKIDKASNLPLTNVLIKYLSLMILETYQRFHV